MIDETKTPARSTLILVVDDNKMSQRMLENCLKSNGYEVDQAFSGEEALALAQNDPVPDLILLDVDMPDMDGFEVCRRLKGSAVTADIPILFVTGMDDDISEEKGLSLGAVDYITKPIKPPIVSARVRVHLELRSYRQFLRLLLARQLSLSVEEMGALEHLKRFDP